MSLRTAIKDLVTKSFARMLQFHGGNTLGTQITELLGTLSIISGLSQTRQTATPLNLTIADSGKLIFCTNAGANTVNLPAPAEGLAFIVANAVDQNLTIAAAAADDIVGFNNAAGSNIAYSTAGQKIGACSAFVAINFNGAGTWKWFHMPLANCTYAVGA